jgi:hypothetical protein
MPGILATELGVLVDVHLLLKLLEGVLGAVGQSVEAGAVEVARGVVVGEHVGRGKGVVGREAVQRVGQHDARWVQADTPATWRGGEKVEKSMREE